VPTRVARSPSDDDGNNDDDHDDNNNDDERNPGATRNRYAVDPRAPPSAAAVLQSPRFSFRKGTFLSGRTA
jgi:hypothetical protein